MIEIDLVIVTMPYSPASRQLISPPDAVLTMAPAKVWQGAVRLQGLRSSPTPDTQVRVACADAGTAKPMAAASADAITVWFKYRITPSPPENLPVAHCGSTRTFSLFWYHDSKNAIIVVTGHDVVA
ncbi:MAG: hypothetical protein ACT6Q3_04250, partial [Sphingopyxis sp.]